MIKNKKGYWYRAIFAIVGSVMLLVGIYLLNQNNFVEAAVLGILGILLITISVFPFAKT
ncbi:MAG: hypothetical protein AABW51_03215 [Nanoarchaeota archaeon]